MAYLKTGFVWALGLLCVASILQVSVQAQSPEERADSLIRQMTLEEKIQQLHGLESKQHERVVPGIPRLGIPELSMGNGPAGIGPTDVVQPHATAFPAPLAVAASWDRKDADLYGSAVADEMRSIQRTMLEAPTVNICRIPSSGRTFEGYGEDPLLSAETAVANINGIQSQHVLADVKHFALNNQERDRLTVSSEADERTIREIYFPAFEASVKRAHVATVMCAYNKVNGEFACQNRFLLNDVLRDEWHFDGFVVSDFGAAHNALEQVRAGLDLEMPSGDTYNDALLEKVKDGTIPESRIDEFLRHRYATMIRFGLFDGLPAQRPLAEAAHGKVARDLASDGMVLLRNENGLLPLSAHRKRSIAVVGPAVDQLLEGGGAAFVLPLHTITPVEGLQARFGDANLHVVGVGGAGLIDRRETIDELVLTPPDAGPGTHGVHAEYYANTEFAGKPVEVRNERIPELRTEFGAPFAGLSPKFSMRWTATLRVPVTGTYTLGFEMWGKMRLWLDGKLLLDQTARSSALRPVVQSITLQAGQAYDLRAEYVSTGRGVARLFWTLPAGVNTPSIAKAVAAARASDVVIVCVGMWAHEGFDAPTLALPEQQNQLIEAVAAVNPRTIVVLQSGTPVLMPWLHQVEAVVEAWYPGEEGGAAIADILSGAANPSAKLPVTFPMSDEQVPASTPRQYPGIDGVAHYSEALEVGYRWQNAHNQQPLFPFGFGLSYTHFSFSNLSYRVLPDRTVDVAVTLKNEGKRDGAEVAQLYLDYPAGAGEPPLQLRGFEKVYLRSGSSRRLSFHLDNRAFAIWSVENHDWKIVPGSYTIAVGNSSRNLPLHVMMQQP